MFCPNCGNDCGNAKFCANCGTKLERGTIPPSQAWSAGMPCPHCGATKLEGGNCAFCGAQLIVAVPEEKKTPAMDQGLDSYEIPYRKYYPDPFSKYCLSVEKDGIVIVTPAFLVTNKLRISYSQLAGATFVFTQGPDVSIVFRWRDPADTTAQRETVFKSARDKYGEDRLYHLFYVIKHLTPAGVEFQVEYPPVREEIAARLDSSVVLEDYFERFNPLRAQAVNALCHESRMAQSDAQELIDDLFNRRQKELYDADSLLAIRDYNRYDREVDRQWEEYKRKKYADKKR